MRLTFSLSRNFTTGFAVAALLSACGTASFTGSGGPGRKSTDNAVPGGTPSDQGSPSGTVTPPAAPAPGPQGPGSGGAPVNPAPSAPQNSTTNTIQTIGGIINTIRNNIDVTRTDREIVFGGDKVFHIGDGRYPASSCQRQIDAYKLSGTKYFFEFEVLEDSTLVDIDILTVCGVDYADSNAVNLMSGSNAAIDQRSIRAGALTTGLNSRTLNKGRYSVMVESKRNTSAGVEGGDNDDFIVGRVRIRASRNINPGDVRVE